MAFSFRDYLFQQPSLQFWDPNIPKDVGIGQAAPSALMFPTVPRILPSPPGDNPFGPLPKVNPPQKTPRSTPGGNILPPPPTWPLPSPSGGETPFPDPPSVYPPKMRPPRDVDPPARNPFNYPDEEFVVTENRSGRAGNEPVGGLFGLMRTVMQQGQIQPGAGPNESGDPDAGRAAQIHFARPPQFPISPEKPIRILSRRLTR
jgi:hypothetical protein